MYLKTLTAPASCKPWYLWSILSFWLSAPKCLNPFFLQVRPRFFPESSLESVFSKWTSLIVSLWGLWCWARLRWHCLGKYSKWIFTHQSLPGLRGKIFKNVSVKCLSWIYQPRLAVKCATGNPTNYMAGIYLIKTNSSQNLSLIMLILKDGWFQASFMKKLVTRISCPCCWLTWVIQTE